LLQLNEDGATALGPAILVASCLASRKPHSEIILCTDGLSNVGLGALDEPASLTDATQFYQRVGVSAKSHQTTINIMALQDSNCALSSLALCATETAGSVNVLHPLEWVAEVQRIAQNPTIATNVHTRLLLPPFLTSVSSYDSSSNGNGSNNNNNNDTSANSGGRSGSVSGRDEKCESVEGVNFVCYNVGNATADTDITFELKSCPPNSNHPPSDFALFQFQTTYTRMDGTQCKRVVSTRLRVTNQRSVAEEACDVAVIALNAIQRAASLALLLDFESARASLLGATRLLQRAATTPTQREELSALIQEAQTLDRVLRSCLKDPKIIQADATAKALHRAKAAPLTQFLSGRRKNIVRRENGVFSNEELREYYYKKKF